MTLHKLGEQVKRLRDEGCVACDQRMTERYDPAESCAGPMPTAAYDRLRGNPLSRFIDTGRTK